MSNTKSLVELSYQVLPNKYFVFSSVPYRRIFLSNSSQIGWYLIKRKLILEFKIIQITTQMLSKIQELALKKPDYPQLVFNTTKCRKPRYFCRSLKSLMVICTTMRILTLSKNPCSWISSSKLQWKKLSKLHILIHHSLIHRNLLSKLICRLYIWNLTKCLLFLKPKVKSLLSKTQWTVKIRM